MFETCMVESAGQLRSKNSKWTTSSAFVLEAALLSLVLLATMIRTERLPIKLPHVAPPYAPVRATEIISTQRQGGGGSVAPINAHVIREPQFIPSGVKPFDGNGESAVGPGPSGPVFPGLIPGASNPSILSHIPEVTVVRQKPIIVSGGVQAARLVQQITPKYPDVAKQTHVEGAVILHAMISRAGTVESLEIVSGHPMLARAALDAVRQWRYRPTYLGGDPVEVETTITMNFVLNK